MMYTDLVFVAIATIINLCPLLKGHENGLPKNQAISPFLLFYFGSFSIFVIFLKFCQRWRLCTLKFLHARRSRVVKTKAKLVDLLQKKTINNIHQSIQ